ncbi:MAG: 16S rRNA (uracil(1498)-N(3))-methyltransferase [Nitrospinales bacterium]
MKNPPRFFVPPEHISNDRVAVRGSDVAHIRTVLRLKPGDDIHVFDGRGVLYTVRLDAVRSREAAGAIVARTKIQTEPLVAITLGQAVLKGNKFDGVIRKAVELGVGCIVPLQTERTVVKISEADRVKKHRRWQKIAAEASKQCGRGMVPTVGEAALSIERFCIDCQGHGLKLAFWENEEHTRLRDLSAAAPDALKDGIACLVGPEGGLTLAEVETARAHGFRCVTLGPRKLRAETASVAVLSIIQNLWGDF